MSRVVPLLILFLFLSRSAWSFPLERLDFEPGLALAHLSESPACRARYDVPGRGAICFPKELWLERIGDPGGSWLGVWKSYSPPQNDPGSAKHVQLRFVVTRSLRHAERDPVLRFVERWRERLSEILAPADELGVARRWLLGESVYAPGSDVLPITGFSRFVAASGLQLYFLFWSVSRVAFFALRALRLRASLALSAGRAAGLAVGALAWLLAGLRAGMLRPFAVLAARALAATLGIRLRPGTLFVLALCLELGFSGAPLEIRARVALGVGAALFVLESLERPRIGSARTAALALGAWWPLAIWEAWSRGTFAPWAPLLNGIALPLFAGAIYPLALAGALGAAIFRGGALLTAAACLANRLLLGLLSLQARSDFLWIISRPALAAGAGLALGLLAFRLPPARRLRAGVGLALALAFVRGVTVLRADTRHPDVATRVEQLDVGQGDAALVQTSAGAGLIDAGSAQKGLSDADWLELLSRRGIDRVAWIALTHLDEDHSGGALRLSRLLPIGCVATSRAELESARGVEFARQLRARGVRVVDWSSPCCPEPVYSPARGGPGRKNANMSAVLVPLRGRGFYLSAGDAEGEAENEIGRWAIDRIRALALGEGLSARVLKLSHHGSRTSSSAEFLRMLRPTEAWISDGVGNPYGHPSPEVVDRVRALAIPVRRTDQQGVIGIGSR